MVKAQKDDVDSIVASHEALNVVSGWLGLSVEDALQADGGGPEQEDAPPRPKFLGLGAKYLPHHKAVGFAGVLDTKLKKRLEAAGRRRSSATLDEQHEAAGAGDSDGEDEEEWGKARQVRQRQPSGSIAASVGHQLHGPGGARANQQGINGSQQAGGQQQRMPGGAAAREALLLGTGKSRQSSSAIQEQQNQKPQQGHQQSQQPQQQQHQDSQQQQQQQPQQPSASSQQNTGGDMSKAQKKRKRRQAAKAARSASTDAALPDTRPAEPDSE